MGCGYACIGCGRCRGEPRRLNISATCFRCGFDNEQGVRRCARCGLELPRPPQAGSDDRRGCAR